MVTRLSPYDVQTRNTDDYPRITPFGDVTVYPGAEHGTVFVWKLHEKWTKGFPEDTKLILEYSEAATPVGVYAESRHPFFDDPNWVHVWSGVPVNHIVDTKQRFYGQRRAGVYRLRLVSKKTEQEWISDNIGIYGRLPFTLWKLMLKVLRAENRTARLYHGTPGYLLKRRWIGVRCTKCTDVLNDDVKVPHCPVCYGTGFVGGYYVPPMPYTLTIEQKVSEDAVDPQHRGAVNDMPVTGRLAATAGPLTYDVWCDSITGDRYEITGLATLVHIQGIPIVYNASLKKIPFSYLIYNLKID